MKLLIDDWFLKVSNYRFGKTYLIIIVVKLCSIFSQKYIPDNPHWFRYNLCIDRKNCSCTSFYILNWSWIEKFCNAVLLKCHCIFLRWKIIFYTIDFKNQLRHRIKSFTFFLYLNLFYISIKSKNKYIIVFKHPWQAQQ